MTIGTDKRCIDEGTVFVPQDITSQDDFLRWVGNTLPELSESDIAKILRYYPISNIKESSGAIKFATNGVSGPSALDQSSLATGQQQRANVRGSTLFRPIAIF